MIKKLGPKLFLIRAISAINGGEHNKHKMVPLADPDYLIL